MCATMSHNRTSESKKHVTYPVTVNIYTCMYARIAISPKVILSKTKISTPLCYDI